MLSIVNANANSNGPRKMQIKKNCAYTIWAASEGTICNLSIPFVPLSPRKSFPENFLFGSVCLQVSSVNYDFKEHGVVPDIRVIIKFSQRTKHRAPTGDVGFSSWPLEG